MNQRQGFLVSAIVHLTLLMILFSRQPETSRPSPESTLPPPERTARVFVPPAEVLKQVLPPTALRPARPVPTPPPPSAKDRISIGPPVDVRQKGPLILRPDDDFTKAPKGRPDVVPTPAPPPPASEAPRPADPVRTADASTQPTPGTEGLRLPPGLGRDLSSGTEGSKAGPSRPSGPPSIASSLRNFEDRLQTGQLGIPEGSGEQQIHGLLFDPMGADFSRWITHFTREVYRNWIMPQPALMGMRGHVDIEFRVEKDGTLSLCRVLNSSTNVAMDRSAKYALESSQFLPLPDDYGPSSVTMRASFFYNEAPSGS